MTATIGEIRAELRAEILENHYWADALLRPAAYHALIEEYDDHECRPSDILRCGPELQAAFRSTGNIPPFRWAGGNNPSEMKSA